MSAWFGLGTKQRSVPSHQKGRSRHDRKAAPTDRMATKSRYPPHLIEWRKHSPELLEGYPPFESRNRLRRDLARSDTNGCPSLGNSSNPAQRQYRRSCGWSPWHIDQPLPRSSADPLGSWTLANACERGGSPELRSRPVMR